jgi:hypothetical protein
LGDTITVTNIKRQKFYFTGIELTSPDLYHLGELFRCHGIKGIIKQTATQSKSGNMHSLCRSNFCGTREDIDKKQSLTHLLYHLPTQVLPRSLLKNLQQKALKVQTLCQKLDWHLCFPFLNLDIHSRKISAH